MLTPSSRVEYLKRLTNAGFEDVLVLQRATAAQVLTEKRMELVENISTRDVTSVRDLARQVDRDVSIVSRDLDVLFEAGVVDFEQNGRAKRPVLAHETVLVEPLVFEGEVNSDGTGDLETELAA